MVQVSCGIHVWALCWDCSWCIKGVDRGRCEGYDASSHSLSVAMISSQGGRIAKHDA